MAKPDPIKVMFVIPPEDRDALQRKALEIRAKRGGSGRVDASEVLRALLAEWRAGGCKTPKALDQKE